MTMQMTIRPFRTADEAEVVQLWRDCGLVVAWNDPHRDIQRKLAVQADLFLVALDGARIVGSAMGGYDGHRGWINYLAVHPDSRRRGIARALMTEAERLLGERGCPKINLQVRRSNREVIEFYRRIGYREDDVVSFGKRLQSDE